MYGIFRSSARFNKNKEEFLYGIFLRFCLTSEEHIHSLIAENKHSLVTDKNDLSLKSLLFDYRNRQRQQNSLSRSHYYSTKFFIHKCDENGLILPSKKELQNACFVAIEMLSYETVSKLIDENKIKQEYLKYFI